MDPLFEVHKLNKKGMEKASKLVSCFDTTLRDIQLLEISEGRELALVKTHLELACFYAKKAIAKQLGNQELPG